MPDPLTDEQRQAVAEVCLADPHGWVPLDENLAVAERLVERGVLTRKLIDGAAVYRPSPAFAAAAATHAAMGEHSQN